MSEINNIATDNLHKPNPRRRVRRLALAGRVADLDRLRAEHGGSLEGLRVVPIVEAANPYIELAVGDPDDGSDNDPDDDPEPEPAAAAVAA